MHFKDLDCCYLFEFDAYDHDTHLHLNPWSEIIWIRKKVAKFEKLLLFDFEVFLVMTERTMVFL